MNPTKAAKLLRLLLCPTAQDGEVLSAARRLQRMLPNDADSVQELAKLLVVENPKALPPPPDAEFPFGKHRGQLVSTVARRDPDYLLWARENLKACRYGLRHAIDFWAHELEAA